MPLRLNEDILTEEELENEMNKKTEASLDCSAYRLSRI